MYAFKECSSCGALYNKDRCCSVDTFVRDPNKTPDSSKQSLPNCPNCGDPVDGLVCRPCAFVRKCLNEVCFTSCDENESFKNLLNPPQQTQTHSSESSNDNTNLVDTLQEPIVENQDPGENFAQNSSQSPPQITQNCCYGCGDSLDGFFCQRCTCESCGNGAHYGYNCPPQVPIISNPEPCYHQDFDELPQTLPSFQQQYLCCENCGGPHETFQCQPMNENYYEPNFCYNSNSFGFDQFQPSQFIIDHIDSMNDHLKAHRNFQQVMDDSMSKLRETFQTWLQQRQEQVVNLDTYTPEPSQYRKIPICYDDDDDEYSFATQEYLKKFSSAITPDLPKSDSLIMEDKHLDTIPETESDELIKSSVENLVPIPSESEDECECDVPDCDDSQTTNFSTFSNPLFDDSTSSDDESSHEEINSLFDEFAGELITIPPRIVNREHEEYISLLERLLYDNSSPRPPKDFHANPNTIIESLPTFPIPVEDSDSLREEIDIFPSPDNSIPSGIESNDYDSEGDDNSTSLLEFESLSCYLSEFGRIQTIDVRGEDIPKQIYDPGYELDVRITRFLATLSPVIDTLIPFSFENEDKVFNHGALASKEKSPPSSSHRGFKASKLFHHKNLMLIHGEKIPILDVSFLHFYPLDLLKLWGESRQAQDSVNKISASWWPNHAVILSIALDMSLCACGFVLHSLELQHPLLHYGNPISNPIDQRLSLCTLNKRL
ncbi:hypothetical protein Tco_0719537 [Tanacetum coccineum]